MNTTAPFPIPTLASPSASGSESSVPSTKSSIARGSRPHHCREREGEREGERERGREGEGERERGREGERERGREGERERERKGKRRRDTERERETERGASGVRTTLTRNIHLPRAPVRPCI
jgi:hypothetical protein